MDKHLTIFGASTRAAAFSALRAGLSPVCADLFADADLQCVCQVMQVREYPQSFAAIASALLPGPWMYTGALENHPQLIDAIAKARPLWGNAGGVLRRVRSPFRVAACLRKAGISCPDLARTPAEASTRYRWLLKPFAGAGGRGISFWTGQAFSPRKLYLQQHIAGEACAAIFVAANGTARLLGVTRQFVGRPRLHARPFAYCGSIGRLPLPQELLSSFAAIGNALTADFGLRGLFGVDCVLSDQTPWPVEVNPRYTASVEVLEHAAGVSSLSMHRCAFADGQPDPATPQSRHQIIGKAILFAPCDFVFPDDGPWRDSLSAPVDAWRLPGFADIPVAGKPIMQGQPILTLFASADTETACEGRLDEQAAQLYKLFIPEQAS